MTRNQLSDLNENNPARPMTIWRAGLIAAGITIAAGSFVLGITLPILQLTRFFVWTDTFSILTMVHALFTDGEVLLGLVVAIFSVFMPAVKIMLLAWVMMCTSNRIVPSWMHVIVSTISKWSMLDVLLIALVIFAVKSSGIGTAISLPGLYFFTLSILLSVAISLGVNKAATS